jgi:hypothetical protein
MVHFITTERAGVFDIEWPEPKPVFYRLYHDADGRPLFYTMEDEPGTYIEIDQAAYTRSNMRVRVRDGKLTEVAWRTTQKLTPGETGTPCDPRNVAIVTQTTPCTKWSKRTYEAS